MARLSPCDRCGLSKTDVRTWTILIGTVSASPRYCGTCTADVAPMVAAALASKPLVSKAQTVPGMGGTPVGEKPLGLL